MDYRGMTLILHRSKRWCNEEKLREELLDRGESAKRSDGIREHQKPG
jgi:hypothetical protein